MIIDNKQCYNSKQTITTVWDCISEYTKANERTGRMDIVTGFFSVAALHILYEELSDKNSYRIVLGDIHDMTRDEDFLQKAVDLLQGDSGLENAFQLSAYAKNAVTFLKRSMVELRTIGNAFCHAKSYLYEDNSDAMHDYAIVGSSNLTEAGLGKKASANIELNLVETGRENASVKDLKRWFDALWKEVASATITVPLENGRETTIDAKAYLIQQIEQIFKAYTPEQIYQKILFELFRADIEMNDSIEYRRDMEFLQKSKIWNTLFDFQQSGVVSLVKLLTRYGGAILADAVGLGKTFSALGVVKYFQNNGYHTLILCPKKLKNNWLKYKHNQGSRFEDDHFDYLVRSHTDLQDQRLDQNDGTKDAILKFEKLLVVVDESHNLRNDKSSRYKMLLNDILNESARRGHTVKVLLLSATPINTGLIDVRNQFNLIGYEENKHFYDEFGLEHPDAQNDPMRVIFQQANAKYTEWSKEPQRNVNTLREKLNKVNHFFKLTDELIIARNRAFVSAHNGNLGFPRQLKPQNEHVGVNNIGSYADIDDMYDDMKILRLTAYQPTQYNYELYPGFINTAQLILNWVNTGNTPIWKTVSDLDVEEQRLFDALTAVKNETRFDELQKMIVQNWVVKQSIKEFNKGRINWDDNALRELSLAGMMISLFIKRLESSWSSCLSTLTKVRDLHEKWLGLALQRSNAVLDDEDEQIIDEAEDIETIGKRAIDFNNMLRIEDYINDLKRDIEILDRLIDNLQRYKNDIVAGRRKDDKLDTLIKLLKDKQETDHKKVIIFTSYADTAKYLYDNIANLFSNKVALVTGDINNSILEATLQRFAPYSKLFLEKDWSQLYKDNGIKPDDYKDNPKSLYLLWKNYIFQSTDYTSVQDMLTNPYDILVATDCVSEGQNLQDADTVINYDIHWNPVRLIQRFGRIDRIGSPNDEIQSINFWPSNDIESYLKLSERVTNRMVVMNVAGSETLQANDTIAQMEQNNQFRIDQDARSLKSIHDDKVGQIEDMGTPTFDALSLSEFKADAEEYAQQHLKELQRIPNGAFSGFHWKMSQYAAYPECLIALLRHREEAKNFLLLCIPINEKDHASFKPVDQAEILQLLSVHKKEDVYLPDSILKADPDTLKNLANLLKQWFENNLEERLDEVEDDDLDGNFSDQNSDETTEERIGIQKYDLIAWDYVSNTNN